MKLGAILQFDSSLLLWIQDNVRAGLLTPAMKLITHLAGMGVWFVLALVLQAITAALLARLAGRIYRMMMFYRGAVPKPAQIIKMLREEKEAAKQAGKEDSHGA